MIKMHQPVEPGLETLFYVIRGAAVPAVEERSLVSAPRTAPPGCCSLFTLARPNTGLDRDKQHQGGLAMSPSVSPLWPGTHRRLSCPLCGAAVCKRPWEGDDMAFPLGEVVGWYIETTNLHLSSGRNSEKALWLSLLCDVLNFSGTTIIVCTKLSDLHKTK